MNQSIYHALYQRLDDDVLRGWPLPMPPADGDKEERGRVLIVAGSHEMSGVAALCGSAALRAGAGKVTLATGARSAPSVALAMPECRVIGLHENEGGGFTADSLAALDGVIETQDAVLIGPGMQDEAAVLAFTRAAMPRLQRAKIVLDAYAMGAVRDRSPCGERPREPAEGAAAVRGHHILLTPHAGELAHLSGAEKEAISDNPEPAALSAAEQWNALVALKGAITLIATPSRQGWRHRSECIGLSASGTGDILAGIIVGLAARGASLEQAAAWGVVLHALAAKRLESRFGPIGYMARELAAEIPPLMHELRARSEEEQ